MQPDGNYVGTMSRLRAIFVRLMVVAAMLAWVGGQLASTIHQLETVHLRCAEHGHTIEIERSEVAAAGHVHAEQDELVAAADCGEHEPHCLHQLLPQTPLAAVTPTTGLPALAHPALPFAAHHHDARGPPLAYAPKTSPPAIA